VSTAKPAIGQTSVFARLRGSTHPAVSAR
jgi:hypothetical protein